MLEQWNIRIHRDILIQGVTSVPAAYFFLCVSCSSLNTPWKYFCCFKLLVKVPALVLNAPSNFRYRWKWGGGWWGWVTVDYNRWGRGRMRAGGTTAGKSNMGYFLSSRCTAQAGKKIWEKNSWGTSEKRTVKQWFDAYLGCLWHKRPLLVTSNTVSSGVL